MKRLFVAARIDPGKKFFDRLHALENQLKHERIKWVEDHNVHITLKFFGETEERKIPEINNILLSVAGKIAPFDLSLQKLGIFGSSYNPKVVWVGIEPYEGLVSIMKLMQDELKRIGYEPDRQNLVPHLTLGRIKFLKDKQLFQRSLDQYRDLSSQVMNVSSYLLFESILRKEGPIYLSLQSFPFKI